MSVAIRQRWILLAAAALLLQARVGLPETVPTRGVADVRIRTAAYDANEVYRIQGYVGYEIDLQFEPGESFVGIGAGDIDALSFVSQDNHLFIKPKASRVNTNLTVLTTRRPYQFVYSASSLRLDTTDPEIMFVVRFSYPPNNGDVIADGVNRMLLQSGAERPRNIDYWYCGSPSIQPTSATDDGIHTRLRIGAGMSTVVGAAPEGAILGNSQTQCVSSEGVAPKWPESSATVFSRSRCILTTSCLSR